MIRHMTAKNVICNIGQEKDAVMHPFFDRNYSDDESTFAMFMC